MKESYKKNAIGIALMGFSAVFVCFGQLFWKLSSTGNTFFLVLGFMLYGMGAVVMIVAYRFGSLSVLQPMLSLNYILSVIVARLILNEQITLFKIAGILCIILGIIAIGGGDE